MALLDISYVTQSLATLIETTVNASPGRNWTADVKVSPQPPDLVTGSAESNVLAFYLYHLCEDPHFKNIPPAGNDAQPVRFTPMGLLLHYHLTAHSQKGDAGTLLEQTMMGLAVKALHDFPVIDDSTEIVDKNNSRIKVLSSYLAGAGNRLRITLLPLAYSEAVSYWTAGSSPLRLAAYYEVSVVMLEPEEITARATRVVRYGVYPFVQGMPRLLTSYNTISFPVPDDSEQHGLMLQPAEVTYGDTIRFKGTGLSTKSTYLLISSPGWDKPVEADPAWSVYVRTDELSATVQTTIGGQILLPGIYAAQVKVTEQRTMASGITRTFERLSNATPFTVTPKVDDPLGTPGADGVLLVFTSIRQQKHLLRPENVLVFIGETRLTLGTWDSLNPGEYADLQNLFSIDPSCITYLDNGDVSAQLSNEFQTGGVTLSPNAYIVVATAGQIWRIYDGDSAYLIKKEGGTLNVYSVTDLQIRLPDGLTRGTWVPFRLVINNAESQPRWVQVPK
jgi:hypothetical protein